ncbi:MAG TPA: hypothetical protein PK400_01360, partial [Phycisphaerales bacterium]|nr:hypothetical protein [Phycisphaerales bacterium]
AIAGATFIADGACRVLWSGFAIAAEGGWRGNAQQNHVAPVRRMILAYRRVPCHPPTNYGVLVALS